MNLTVKHLDAELIAYINGAKSPFERRARMIAVKLKVEGAVQKEALDYVTIVAKRTIGEYNRTKGKSDETYTEEIYVYGTPYKTAFNYIVKNHNHFFTYFKFLIDTYGEENVEIHRTDDNYSAESVVALLIADHKSVHNVKYVTYEFIKEGSIRSSFNTKEDLRKHFKLSENKLQKALEARQFTYEGHEILLKIVSSSVEVDFLKEIKLTEGFIQNLERAKLTAPNLKEQRELAKQIARQQQEMKLVHKLLEDDNFHNQRVLNLKGNEPDDVWKQVATELKMNYQNQKKAVLQLIKDELVDLFIDGSRIDFEQFYKITKDMTRIENILKDLKKFEYEIEDYGILIKLKQNVA